MDARLTINGGPNASTAYVGWAPVPAQLSLVDPLSPGPVEVTVRNQEPQTGGRIVFALAGSPSSEPALPVTVPPDGSPVDLLIAGQFGSPSTADGDTAVEVVRQATGELLVATRLMVRVRKDADTLTTAERDRFLSALAGLNDRGMGAYSDYPNIHTSAGSPEAHDNPGFLPWHRAFLLDLERELQAIDPSVSLHYWRFDEPGPNVFTRGFMGVPAANGLLQFAATNPLQFWATASLPGIVRRPLFNVATEPASVSDEATTLALGGSGHRYVGLRDMEGDPHGFAHTSFTGFIRSIGTAANDPLFFMLHANADRLWAKWQWLHRRFDLTSASTFTPLGAFGSPGAARIGHNLDDTMWPWNQVVGGDRPATAPGGNFPPSLLTAAPGPIPTVGALIDYQGVRTPGSRLGFDYDDVPFEAS
ncbi:MAG: tyrosinase family protein [Chloroflexi bacterium]|nr:tyrosinase family protein [Chloroflexota bacterium]